MLHYKRSSALSNARPRAGLADADPVRQAQYEWAAQSAPLVLIASSFLSVRKAWREGAQAFRAVIASVSTQPVAAESSVRICDHANDVVDRAAAG